MELPLGISSHKVTGGNWDNQANAGVFNLNLNNARTITNQNVGFSRRLASALHINNALKESFSQSHIWIERKVCERIE